MNNTAKTLKGFADDFNHIVEEFEKKHLEGSATVHFGLQMIKLFLDVGHHQNGFPKFETDRFWAALMTTGFGREIQTREVELKSGVLIEALVRFGCPKRQARLFYKTYWHISTETAEKRHAVFLGYISRGFDLPSAEEFVETFAEWLSQEIERQIKPATNSQKFPKAVAAFSRLKENLSEVSKWNANQRYTSRVVGPFEILSSDQVATFGDITDE